MECPHNESHILASVTAVLRLPQDIEGCILEAGCFKGGSICKFSLLARQLNRNILVYDSFEGLPENTEKHERSIHGYSIKGWFEGQNFCGTQEEVKSNIEQFGDSSVVQLVKGWFCDTLPSLSEKICAT